MFEIINRNLNKYLDIDNKKDEYKEDYPGFIDHYRNLVTQLTDTLKVIMELSGTLYRFSKKAPEIDYLNIDIWYTKLGQFNDNYREYRKQSINYRSKLDELKLPKNERVELQRERVKKEEERLKAYIKANDPNHPLPYR